MLLHVIVAVGLTVLYFLQISDRTFSLLLVIFGVPFVIAGYSLVAQRLRDFNVSGWFALALLPINALEPPEQLAIVGTFLVLISLIPGTEGKNRFGEHPQKQLYLDLY